MRGILSTLIATVLLAAPSTSAVEGDLLVELRLRGAVARDLDRLGEPDERTLFTTLRRIDGRWERLWATTPRYNAAQHVGRVLAAELGEDGLAFDLLVILADDPWVKGGHAHYHVELAAQEDGTLSGGFSGDFQGREFEGGRAEGRLLQRPPPPDGFVAPARGEHPRLLFRAGDLEALRAKAQTPFGRACVAQMDDSALGLGMRYQLTGDENYAERAAVAVRAHMADNENGDKAIRCRFVGWRLEQVAMAFDLCHDAWDEGFRREVVAYMKSVCYRMFYSKGQWTEYIIWKPTAPYTAAFMYAAGLAGLAMYDEPGERPVAPPDPFAGRDPQAVVAGAADPPAGAPVAPFADGQLPGAWLYAGGIPSAQAAAALRDLGAFAEARPAAGATIGEGEHRATFARPGKKAFWNGNIDITGANGHAYFTHNWFYTVIDNDAERWVRFDSGFSGGILEPRVRLNGIAVKKGDVLRLGPGHHPLLIEAPISKTNPWGKIFMRPRLVEIPADEAAAAIAAMRSRQADRRALHEFDCEQYERTGADVQAVKYWELARDALYTTFSEGVVAGGGQAGSAHELLMDGPAIYATCHRNVTGTYPSPERGTADWVPRKLMQLVFTGERGYLTQHLQGPSDFSVRGYHESRDLAGHELASLFPLIRERYRPLALWFWNRHYGVTGPEDVAGILACDRRPMRAQLVERSGVAETVYTTVPIYAFLHYPLDMEPQAPGVENLPLTWRCDNGLRIFRSGHGSADDFVLSATANTRWAQPVAGPLAGCFQLVGLGQRWTGPTDVYMRGLGSREAQSVVFLPEFYHFRTAPGEVLYERRRDDGSGVLAVDLSRVYSAVREVSRKVKKDKKKGDRVIIRYDQPYEPFGNLVRESALVDTGISGWRTIGVDYSGASGAPCLLVLADRVVDEGDEARPKVWLWQLDAFATSLGKAGENGVKLPDPQEPYTFREEEVEGVTVRERSFTIVKGDAVLRGTFILPRRVELRVESFARNVRQTHDAVARIGRLAVTARGGDDFLCVVTVQRGEAPAVRSETGEVPLTETQVRVGKRLIRCEGHKLIFTEP